MLCKVRGFRTLILTALAFILLYSVASVSRLHTSTSVMFEHVAARSSNLLSKNVIAFSEKILNNKAGSS